MTENEILIRASSDVPTSTLHGLVTYLYMMAYTNEEMGLLVVSFLGE